MAKNKRQRKKQLRKARAQAVVHMSRVELEDELKKWVDKAKNAEGLMRLAKAENDINVQHLEISRSYLIALVNTLNNFAPLSAVTVNINHAFELYCNKELEFTADENEKNLVHLTLIDKAKTKENESCDEADNSKTS